LFIVLNCLPLVAYKIAAFQATKKSPISANFHTDKTKAL